MALTALTLACMLLTAQPGPHSPAEPFPIAKRNIRFPINIEAAYRPQMKQLLLYVSRDEGKSWQQEVAVAPDAEAFNFLAPADGIYWLTVAVVDKDDKQQPPSPYNVAPNQKVLVDTVPPDVKIDSLERQGEDVLVSWTINEEHPDLTSMKLEYRQGDSPSFPANWCAVPITPELVGKTRFHLASSAPVQLRLEIKDVAKNVGTVEKEIPPVASERITTAAIQPTQPAPTGPVASGPGTIAIAASSSSPLQSSPAPIPVEHPTPPVADRSVPLPGDRTAPLVNDRPAPLGADRAPLAYEHPAPSPLGSRPDPYQGNPVGNDVGNRVVAVSHSTTDPGIDPPDVAVPNPQLNQTQVLNDKTVSLDFKVMKAGPSAVGKVQLWMTRDDGQSWELAAENSPPRSPIATKPLDDGVYGFRLVAVSGVGLSKGCPRRGELPEMRVEIDTTPPSVTLFEPTTPQPGDKMMISWKAVDRNFGTTPITIEFSDDRPEAQWKVIAANLPNTGSYAWQLRPDMGLPYHVRLRVTAVDQAGNQGVAEMTNVIPIDPVRPDVRLIGLAVMPKH